ncbi:MAG: hypothetical protein ACM359_13585, partial [Bacillota bacterium]
AKRHGLAHIDQIIHRWALPRGWPEEIARQYLCTYLHYDIGPRQLEAIALFHHLAAKHNLIGPPIKPLRIWEDPKDDTHVRTAPNDLRNNPQAGR